MAIKFYGAEMEGVTQLENRIADPAQFIGSRDDGRMFFNSTAQAIKFGAGGIFKTLDIPTGTIMLFGQSSAPAGWTKKTDWQNNSMLLFTNESQIRSGGNSDGLDSTGTLFTTDAAGSHSHTVDSHNHTIAGHALSSQEMPYHAHVYQTGAFAGNSPPVVQFLSYTFGGGTTDDPNQRYRSEYAGGLGGVTQEHTHGGGATGNDSPGTDTTQNHTHDFSQYYQTVIAAIKD